MDEKKVKQYIARQHEDKQKHPDAIVLFRIGDFYEALSEDAVIVSGVCGTILAKRENIEVTGFPHHSLDINLPKIVRARHRVCIDERDI